MTTFKAETCLDPAKVASMLEKVEPIIDKTDKQISGPTFFDQDGCDKRVYRRHYYRIVMYKDPKEARRDAAVIVRPLAEIKVYTPECLARGEAEVNRLDMRTASLILRRERAENAWRWYDLDYGAVSWLSCGNTTYQDWNASIANMVHETLHRLNRDDCLYSPYEASSICFTFSAELPTRAIARYETFPFKIPLEVDVYTHLQAIYLDATGDQRFEVLLDELNAYTITADIMTRYLAKDGRNALFDRDGKRNAVFVSAFLAFTVRYFDRLRRQDNGLYQKNFGPSTANRKGVQALLTEAERSYMKWTRALQGVGESEKESEAWFFAEYLRLKAGV